MPLRSDERGLALRPRSAASAPDHEPWLHAPACPRSRSAPRRRGRRSRQRCWASSRVFHDRSAAKIAAQRIIAAFVELGAPRAPASMRSCPVAANNSVPRSTIACSLAGYRADQAEAGTVATTWRRRLCWHPPSALVPAGVPEGEKVVGPWRVGEDQRSGGGQGGGRRRQRSRCGGNSASGLVTRSIGSFGSWLRRGSSRKSRCMSVAPRLPPDM
jgi:hypothetical protein